MNSIDELAELEDATAWPVPRCAVCPRTDTAGKFWDQAHLCPACWVEWELSPEFLGLQGQQPSAKTEDFVSGFRAWLHRAQRQSAIKTEAA